jgi:hypothetical protein
MTGGEAVSEKQLEALASTERKGKPERVEQ